MKYKISLFSGESILLEDEKYHRVLAAWDAGAEEFNINGTRVNRKSIATIGYTSEAAEEMRIEDQNYVRTLPDEQAKQLKEKRYHDACYLNTNQVKKIMETTKIRVWKTVTGAEAMKVEIPETKQTQIAMSNEESERGAAEYWIDANGEKMYS